MEGSQASKKFGWRLGMWGLEELWWTRTGVWRLQGLQWTEEGLGPSCRGLISEEEGAQKG